MNKILLLVAVILLGANEGRAETSQQPDLSLKFDVSHLHADALQDTIVIYRSVPMHRNFGVVNTTLAKLPGVSAANTVNNVVPMIEGFFESLREKSKLLNRRIFVQITPSKWSTSIYGQGTSLAKNVGATFTEVNFDADYSNLRRIDQLEKALLALQMKVDSLHR